MSAAQSKSSRVGYLFKQKYVPNGSWLNLSANTYKTFYMIENFICQFYDSMYVYRIFIISTFFCFPDFSYTPGLTSVVFNQPTKYFKIWYFCHENPESLVDKNGTSDSFNTHVKVAVCWHSLHISRSSSKIWQNMVTVELAGKLDN